jgi:hypothetical protein
MNNKFLSGEIIIVKEINHCSIDSSSMNYKKFYSHLHTEWKK